MQDQKANRLALGTVQFGLDYGINNQRGQVSAEEINQILNLAAKEGIDLLDTAHAYGNSEIQLGANDLQFFKIVSKLPPDAKTPVEVNAYFEASLQNLKQDKLYGYLLHQFSSVEQEPSLWPAFQQLKKKDLVQKIGFSLYSPRELHYLWKHQLEFDLLQVPFNIFDQRFAPYFEKLKNKGVEIHTRSTFLQGLFFKPLEQLPSHFEKIRPKLDQIRAIATEAQLSIADLCLGFVLANPLIDKIVIGVDNAHQLAANLQAVEHVRNIASYLSVLKSLEEQEEVIINPAKWKV